MKKIMIAASMLFSSVIIAQQAPTPNPPNDPTTSLAAPQKGQYAWFRGGNLNTGNPATNSNVFGTLWNSPIYTYTNGVARMKLNSEFNATTQYNIGNHGWAQGVNTSGYLLLGVDNFAFTPNSMFVDKGAHSLLHLNGEGQYVQQAGYRTWMKTGITFTGNEDAGYIGLRAISPDATDMVINWSDNPGTGPGAQTPDNLVFTFTSFDGTNLSGLGDLVGDSENGRETMRMNSNGNIGIGPRFNNANQPKSTLHQHEEDDESSWMQITNQRLTAGINNGAPTPINDFNGLRMGILGDPLQNRNGNALIYQQENKHLLFSTNAATINVNALITRERMRITAVGAETELAGNLYGIYNPANINNPNITRVSISHNPTNPVTRPLSLLHLGYNTGESSSTPGATDGWRDWMDIGTFTSNGTDNVYIGLKNEASPSNPSLPANDKHDAVINWGDNGGNNPLSGPDNLRFIFTETQTSAIPGNAPATSNDGLEVARFSPEAATTLTAPTIPTTNFGMMGIGDFNNNPIPIDAKLDIDGDLRIRQVNEADSLVQVLVIDSSDHNRVYWKNIDVTSNVVANNGVSVDAGIVKLGVPCSDSLGNIDTTAILANALTDNRVVAFRNHHLWFASLNRDSAGVGIGGQPAYAPFCETGNTVEISANNKNKRYGNTDASGLRFTKLTSASPTTPDSLYGINPTKVLTVDSAGDVVLVDISNVGSGNVTADNGTSISPANNVQLGQIYTPGTPAFGGAGQLIHHTEVPFNGSQILFSGVGNSGSETFAIGQDPVFSSKSSVYNDTEQHGFFSHMDANNTQLVVVPPPAGHRIKPAIRGVSNIDNATTPGATAGVVAEGYSNATWGAWGVYAVARGEGTSVVGGQFSSRGYANTFGASSVRGVIGNASGVVSGNTEVTGGLFTANGGDINYGIWASAPIATNVNYAGWFEGDVEVNGVLTVTGIPVIPSDQQFKTNTNGISNAQSIISQMQPKEFYFDTASYSQINFSAEKQYGLIAQEVELILPELVSDRVFPAQFDSLGNVIHPAVNYKALNYNAFIAILMKGMQEQNQVIDSLMDAVEILANCVNDANLCNAQAVRTSSNTDAGQLVELTNLNAIILDQNLPNPFAENTVITYSIPNEVMEAQLLFYDMNGRIIKQVEITERGESKMTVYGDNLKNGIYTYSLIADGKLIATKKMVKQ